VLNFEILRIAGYSPEIKWGSCARKRNKKGLIPIESFIFLWASKCQRRNKTRDTRVDITIMDILHNVLPFI
jgi:hypothetical protein